MNTEELLTGQVTDLYLLHVALLNFSHESANLQPEG